MSITIPTPLDEQLLEHLTHFYRYQVPNNDSIEHENFPKTSGGKPKVGMCFPVEDNPTVNTAQFFFWAKEYGVDNLKVGYKIRMSCGNRLCVNPEHMELLDNKGNVIHYSDNVEKELNNEIITEKLDTHKTRIGQVRLRQEAIDTYKRCPITGISNTKRLIVSHIKPWRYSANDERLDVNNCLLLEARWDNLFDKFLISFNSNGEIIFSDELSKEEQKMLENELQSDSRIPINEDIESYLQFHRERLRPT